MPSHESTLTTTTPDGAATTRPVPPSWATVAPLLEIWQMALVPQADGTWDVLAGFVDSWMPHHEARRVAFAGLPQAIADVAARCAAAPVSEHGADVGEGEG